MKIPDYCFLRHGETAFNKAGILHGQLDSDLTELGKSQAIQQAKSLKKINFSRETLIYSSPLGRAVSTAEIIKNYCSLNVQTDQNLAEVMMGEWQGRTWNEIRVKAPQFFSNNKTIFEISMLAPRGERYFDLCRRAERFISSVSTPAIIISHGVILNIVRGLIYNLSFEQMTKLSQRQGEVFISANQGTSKNI